MHKVKELGFSIVTLVLAIFAMLFLGECVVRLFAPPHLWHYRDATSDWQLDTTLGWVQKPDLNVTSRNVNGELITFKTNHDGLFPATAVRQRAAGTIRIMLFGNSTVVGRWVPQDQTIDRQLERLLRGAGVNAEVINAGVQGYGTDQVYLRMQQLVPLYHPDIVSYGFCDNDLLEILADRAYGSLSKPEFVFGENDSLILRPSDMRNSRITMFGKGMQKWVQYSALYRFFFPQILLVRSWFMDWDKKFMLGLSTEPYRKPESLERFNWRLFTALLVSMNRYAHDNGVRFFFYAHPDAGSVWEPFIAKQIKQFGISPQEYNRHAFENKLGDIAGHNGIAFFPIVDYFLKEGSSRPFHLLPRDPHCNSLGYAVTAKALIDRVMPLTRTLAGVGYFSNNAVPTRVKSGT